MKAPGRGLLLAGGRPRWGQKTQLFFALFILLLVPNILTDRLLIEPYRADAVAFGPEMHPREVARTIEVIAVDSYG